MLTADMRCMRDKSCKYLSLDEKILWSVVFMHRMYVAKIGEAWFGAVLGDDETVAVTSFSHEGREKVVAKILEDFPSNLQLTEAKPEGTALELLENMHLVYEGKQPEREFKFDMNRLPPFFRKALLVTYSIPRGYVATYGGIAAALGNNGAARAVGTAEATNPFAPIVPCHRVVAANLRLGGYGGGLKLKRAILEREGVVFAGNRISLESLWTPKVQSQP